MASRNHPDLFDDIGALPPPSPELVALGSRIPASIAFGTSTWTYDGWTGDVYHRAYRGAQPARRLEEYARYPVLGPYSRAFSDHAGPFVFEFPAMRGKDLPEPARWAEELDAFLKQLPRDFRYAVELRNAELLTDVHGAVLARHGVAHVFNSWNEMPSIGEQLELPWTFAAGFTVARGLLRPGRRYADAVKLFEPYERIRDPQPEVRHDLLRLVAEALRRRIDALILVNNRLEGNAPGTIRALAAALTGEVA